MGNVIYFSPAANRSSEERAEIEARAIRAQEAAEHAREEREAKEREEAREVDLESFAARIEYQRRRSEPTQNADGVRVGDLFYSSWGYEQTNVDFYEVVALKGKHTAVIRKISGEYIGGYSWSGEKRPERGHYTGEEITARTRTNTYYQPGRPQVRDRRTDRWMDRTTDDARHSYSTYG